MYLHIICVNSLLKRKLFVVSIASERPRKDCKVSTEFGKLEVIGNFRTSCGLGGRQTAGVAGGWVGGGRKLTCEQSETGKEATI